MEIIEKKKTRRNNFLKIDMLFFLSIYFLLKAVSMRFVKLQHKGVKMIDVLKQA